MEYHHDLTIAALELWLDPKFPFTWVVTHTWISLKYILYLNSVRWQIDKATHWGDLESEEEEESEDEMEEDQPEVDTESLADGLSSVVSGYSSLPSGLETPEVLDLRKGKAGGKHCCTFASLISYQIPPVRTKLCVTISLAFCFIWCMWLTGYTHRAVSVLSLKCVIELQSGISVYPFIQISCISFTFNVKSFA